VNSRQRFLAILNGVKPDRPPLFPEGIRDEALQSWQGQGLPAGANLEELFLYDPFEQLDPDVYPKALVWDWSNPARLLARLRRSLDVYDPQRLPGDWEARLHAWRGREHPLFLRVHQGLFLSLGVEDWRSFAPAMLCLVDQPEFARQILSIQASFAARLAELVLRQVDLDGVIFSEPVAGNHGTLVSPEMYRSFALESYVPVFEVLCRHQVPAVIWRSYANPIRLVPEVLKYPFNVLWLCETPPGVLSPEQLPQLVPPQITLMGGIDGDVLYEDEAAIRQAVEAVRPFVEAGRFIPLADGRVREDVPYANYAFYRQELERVFVGNYSRPGYLNGSASGDPASQDTL
jgi:hypothetical protein